MAGAELDEWFSDHEIEHNFEETTVIDTPRHLKMPRLTESSRLIFSPLLVAKQSQPQESAARFLTLVIV